MSARRSASPTSLCPRLIQASLTLSEPPSRGSRAHGESATARHRHEARKGRLRGLAHAFHETPPAYRAESLVRLIADRRFWPLRCGTIDIAALARDRDQLWAEAVHRFREGAIWWIDDPATLAEAAAAQEARYQADAWDARIDRWLTHDTRSVNRGHAGYEDWQFEEFERPEAIRDVSVGEILEGALGIEPAKWTKGDQMRVGAWLKSRDWEKYRRRSDSAREWRYRKQSTE
ncbi:VapE domain-containing protein [Cereibacter johrii]|uniref:VapE domain-containing protein n=1 Tax=Cereibacter johrii TaxID=445629 RepID=UPI003CECB21B